MLRGFYISDIMNNIKIGTICILKDYELVDGYKRIISINSFIDGKITYDGRHYSELTDDEKNNFNNYRFSICVGDKDVMYSI